MSFLRFCMEGNMKRDEVLYWLGIPYKTKFQAEIAALRAKQKEVFVVIERRIRNES